MQLYVAGWSLACFAALVLLVLERKRLPFRDYGRFLTQRWKLTTFSVAAVGLTMMAPYTGDPTWDYTDALFMSVLTFLTAPWALAIFYRRPSLRLLYCALCVWLFSASWSYDAYIFARDHVYPATWKSNLFASSVLYFAAGLLWNLEWQPGAGMKFSFQRPDWPRPLDGPQFRRIAWLALAIMILVALGFVPFLC